MEYIGLLSKFPVNRPLTAEERKYQLKQKTKLKTDPIYQLAAIRMNSTFLEIVDKFYAWKGFVTLIAGSCGVGLPIVMLGSMLTLTIGRFTALSPSDQNADLLVLGVLLLMATPVLALGLWCVLKESFRYTHYPIRLNRKNRMVYVFRLDGTVLSVPWDEVFFTLGKGQMRGFYEIRGHVLAADRDTVLETFAFSFGTELKQAELDTQPPEVMEQDYVRRHWEFLRRYMEEGPAKLIGQVEFVMPIATRREGFLHGFHRLMATFAPLGWGAFVIGLPIALPTSLARWFAMRTSKVPVWPEQVETACPIAPDDPYVKEAA